MNEIEIQVMMRETDAPTQEASRVSRDADAEPTVENQQAAMVANTYAAIRHAAGGYRDELMICILHHLATAIRHGLAAEGLKIE